MNLELNLKLESNKETQAQQRVRKATEKKKLAKYEPTWAEVWETGYKTHTGTIKKAIFQTKITDSDRAKLLQVKQAIEVGEIPSGVESLSKFTKTKALGLYKVLMEVRKEQIIKDMVRNCPANYRCITTMEQLKELEGQLATEDVIAVDTETTGVDIWGKDIIVGVSLTLPKADLHVYIPVRHELEDEQLDPVMVFGVLKPHLENSSIRKMLHNSKFDIHMLKKEGIELQGLYLDTMVAMHLLNENEPSFALKNLATKYGKFFVFEDKSMTYEELFGKGGFEKTPLDIGTVYACKDTHLTYKFGC